MDLAKRLSTLKSTWGLLSGASIFFPGAAYLLNVASIKTSQLSSFYPATAIPFGALILLIVLLVFPKQAPSRFSRVFSSLAILTAVLVATSGTIAFVYFSQRQNEEITEDGHTECYSISPIINGSVSGESEARGDGYVTTLYRHKGRITETRKPCEYRQSPPAPWEFVDPNHPGVKWTGQETKVYRMDPVEYFALVFFDLCFIGLTASFTMISILLKEKNLA